MLAQFVKALIAAILILVERRYLGGFRKRANAPATEPQASFSGVLAVARRADGPHCLHLEARVSL